MLVCVNTCALAQETRHAPPCQQCAEWNKPAEPFRIYGNTYYVGPHGLSSILITSASGHVLIDGALPESAPRIAANIQALGFRLADVKLIVNSHVHFDHAGGIAELQRLSGAEVAASAWSADVLSRSGVGKGDPQFHQVSPIPTVSKVTTLRDGQVFRAGGIAITAHLTPGHTPGGTSWSWQSEQDGRVLNLVYADSVMAVSDDGFRFSDNPDYPSAVADFEKSFAFLRTAACDILLTPHPDASGLWTRVEKRREGAAPDPMIAPNACKELASRASGMLSSRLESEKRR